MKTITGKALLALLKTDRVVVAVIPLFLLWLQSLFLDARTPFYINNQDPAYLYLSSFVTLGEFNFTDFVDHPALIWQLVGAVICRIAHAIWSGGLPYAESLIAYPEHYLLVVSWCLQVMFVYLVYQIGIALQQLLCDLSKTILCQLVLLFSSTFTIYRSVGVSAEVMVMIVSFSVIWLCIRYLSADSVKRACLSWGIWFGLGGALILGTKLTAVPLLAFVFLVPENWKQRWIAAGVTVFGFGIQWLVAIPSLDYFTDFVGRIFFKGGEYGGGSSGFDVSQMGENFLRILKSDPLMVFFLFLSLFIALPSIRTNGIVKNRILSVRLWDRLVLSCFIAFAGHWLIVAKQFRQHYLLGATPLYVLLVIFFYCGLVPGDKKKLKQWAGFVLSACIITLGGMGAFRVLNSSHSDGDKALQKLAQSTKYAELPLYSVENSITYGNAFAYFGVFNKSERYERFIRKHWTEVYAEGEIEFSEMISRLERSDYQGFLLISKKARDAKVAGFDSLLIKESNTYQLRKYVKIK
ncbi:MAG: hypothetical protein MI748_09535 [Opitutales bacterium]|nr:hypothetical protein [Opitutales bacterium]